MQEADTIRRTYQQWTSLLAAIRDRLKDCNEQTLVHTYKIFIGPVAEYRAIILSTATTTAWESVAAAEPRMLRRIFSIEPSGRNLDLYYQAARRRKPKRKVPHPPAARPPGDPHLTEITSPPKHNCIIVYITLVNNILPLPLSIIIFYFSLLVYL